MDKVVRRPVGSQAEVEIGSDRLRYVCLGLDEPKVPEETQAFFISMLLIAEDLLHAGEQNPNQHAEAEQKHYQWEYLQWYSAQAGFG